MTPVIFTVKAPETPLSRAEVRRLIYLLNSYQKIVAAGKTMDGVQVWSELGLEGVLACASFSIPGRFEQELSFGSLSSSGKVLNWRMLRLVSSPIPWMVCSTFALALGEASGSGLKQWADLNFHGWDERFSRTLGVPLIGLSDKQRYFGMVWEDVRNFRLAHPIWAELRGTTRELKEGLPAVKARLAACQQRHWEFVQRDLGARLENAGAV